MKTFTFESRELADAIDLDNIDFVIEVCIDDKGDVMNVVWPINLNKHYTDDTAFRREIDTLLSEGKCK